MGDILHRQFFDNTLLAYLEVAGVILFAIIIKRLISKLIARLLYKSFTDKEKSLRRQTFLDLIVSPLEIFIIILVVVISINKLNFPGVLNFTIYKITTRQLLDGVVNLALVITFIRVCIKLVLFAALLLQDRALKTPDQADNQLVIFFRDFFKILLILLGGLLILKFVFNYDVGNLVTGLSLVGAAVALATKESLENLIASFIIFFDKPFTTGDIVKVQGFTGGVERIGLRSTRIRTDQKTYITVPNKQMVDSILDNITLRTQRRSELRLEIVLATPTDLLKKVIDGIKAILNKEFIESNSVLLNDTGRNAHVITVEYFTGIQQSFNDFNLQREQVIFEVIDLLQQNGILLAAANPSIIIKHKD